MPPPQTCQDRRRTRKKKPYSIGKTLKRKQKRSWSHT
ncbi:hypothetical protein L915_20613 [Phytophthora nicotianae]|uniref:Uncharacterized protein n=1 Tax=Phytophthora nicotianae TaxID=4792 RepID=W2FNK0_PHYNI|nr:hypothetical protein L915_20613 [Phytophthora nicotianae]